MVAVAATGIARRQCRFATLAAWFVVAGAAALFGCGRAPQAPALFEALPPSETGVAFVNELPDGAELNIVNYPYYYDGGGVAVGDVDGNGLPDLYFTANLRANRLYLNHGDYRFEDVTERAGVAGANGWTTGATMADVNGDGHVDIYVSGVDHLSTHGHNILYINNGDGTFVDRTAEYGLEHVGYSTQAAFFDADGDGDLDMYLLNHSVHGDREIGLDRRDRHPKAGDRLFRNDGGWFVDVSDTAGIFGGVEGYGLGVVVSDLDVDGCPDVFVANDFHENDFLYRSNCDGTFTEVLGSAMGHTSESSMGVDAADFNNDLRPDVVVLDMLPEREDILKTSETAVGFEAYRLMRQMGYHPQYARNTLQLNRGRGRFSEIGYLSGVHATDWSWASLFADLDNDGYKDLFITNGIYHRPNDLDYLAFVRRDSVQAVLQKGVPEDELRMLEKMPHVPIANYAYRNRGRQSGPRPPKGTGADERGAQDGGLTFTNEAEAWGLSRPGFSSGAAYVDLNNTGTLDLVVNNINAPASIYRNRGRDINGYHYLKMQLRGSGGNTAGIGTKVFIEHGGLTQMLEQMPTRGFQSSVDTRLHFGLGTSQRIDSLIVVWPDQRFQVLTDVAADTTITLDQEDAAGNYPIARGVGASDRMTGEGEGGDEGEATAGARRARGGWGRPAVQPLFTDVTEELGIDFEHEENAFFDDSREPLMPHRVSTEGPALAVADVNGDGLDDIYAGGAKRQPGRLLIQEADGRFRSAGDSVFHADRLHEDVDAAFFDANGDGHADLYVVSAGNEFWGDHEALRDRLYINDGRGNLHRGRDRLPDFFTNGSCVVPADFDGDGDVDLFVGGRVVARNYGVAPRSHLLANDGDGRFDDVTSDIAEPLAAAGMVTAATWLDYDHDGQLDLVVVGEWMPIRLFRQEHGRFVERTADAGFSDTNGWWNAVVAADLTGDGHDDLVLGNLGLNSYITASPDEPAQLYVHDFSGNGALEQILTFYKGGVRYPIAERDELIRLLPELRGRYESYADYGASRIEEIFTASELRQAKVLRAYDFASAVALNGADGTFALRRLPVEAQLAPVYAILADDFNADGYDDVLVAGNFYSVPPVRGRYDASYGLLLRGDGAGRFEAVDLEASGVLIEGQARALERLRRPAAERLIVVARNNDALQFLRPPAVAPP